MPLGSGLPNRDQHRSWDQHLLSKRPPYFSDQAERAVNPTILPNPQLSKGIDAGRAPTPVQGEEPSTLVIRVKREEVHRVGTPFVIQKLKPIPGEHPVLRDNHLGDLLREGVLLTGNPFHRNCDSVAQSKPENISCHVVDRELRPTTIHDPRQILRIHL